MSMEVFLKIREMGKQLKEKRGNEVIDYNFGSYDVSACCSEDLKMKKTRGSSNA